jgi:hypothetical protein
VSTIIQFECRNAEHRLGRPRAGVGGIVLHHGTFGYCDGSASNTDHRWTPTGGVLLEQLVREDGDDRSDDTRYVPHAIGSAGPLQLAR